MINRDGIAKVLDFGLAKLTEQKAVEFGSDAETRALVQTKAGVVMGTVSYMSPKQAKGKDTDERTNICIASSLSFVANITSAPSLS